jgi:formylmethanofuran dehydrogenase subunit B
MICTNGAHSADIVHDPDRLAHPLRRVGPKGTYEFERISWDEAYEIIVEKLGSLKERYGPESTAIYTGRGSFELALCDVFQPAGVAISSASSVLFPFGSPNTLGVGALCYVSFAMIAPHVTLGEYYHTMDHDIESAELIVIWGANPATDSPPLAHEQIKKAVLRGADVVCIDPQLNHTAREVGAEWVAIRPGTDGALALGMINVLVEEELYDESFVENWTVGFEELKNYVQHFRPEVVEDITGVPAAKVIDLARRIARARGACPIMYTGLEYSDSGVQAIRAVFSLWALAGQLDVPGGLNIRMQENNFPINRTELIRNPDVRKALGRDRFPVYSLYRGESHAIALPDSVLKGEPYKIRSLIVLGGSIVTAWPNPSIWRETLSELDFLVSINRHHTADSAYADIVLPATTMYEITSYMTYGPIFKIREAPRLRRRLPEDGRGPAAPRARGLRILSRRSAERRRRSPGSHRDDGVQEVGEGITSRGRAARVPDAIRQVRDRLQRAGGARIRSAPRLHRTGRGAAGPAGAGGEVPSRVQLGHANFRRLQKPTPRREGALPQGAGPAGDDEQRRCQAAWDRERRLGLGHDPAWPGQVPGAGDRRDRGRRHRRQHGRRRPVGSKGVAGLQRERSHRPDPL